MTKTIGPFEVRSGPVDMLVRSVAGLLCLALAVAAAVSAWKLVP